MSVLYYSNQGVNLPLAPFISIEILLLQEILQYQVPQQILRVCGLQSQGLFEKYCTVHLATR